MTLYAIIEAGGAAFQSLLAFYFYNKVLELKPGAKRFMLPAIAAYFLINIAGMMLPPPYMGFVYMAVNLLCILMYRDGIAKKISVIAGFIAMGTLSETGVGVFLLGLNVPAEALMTDGTIAKGMAIIASDILFFVLTQITAALIGRKNISNISGPYWAWLMVIPAVTFFMSAVLCIYASNYDNPIISLMAIFSTIMFFLNLYVFFIFDKITGLAEAKNRLELLAQQGRYQYEHYKLAESSDQQLRKVRHDMNNHFFVIGGYIKAGEYDKALEYLENINNSIKNVKSRVDSGNQVMDSIISVKLAEAREMGIETECSTAVPDQINMEPADVCTLFGNLMDNAVEGAQRCKTGKPYIKVALGYKNNSLYGEIRNSAEEKTVKIKNGKLESSKRKKGESGIGMENIRSIVEKYGGSLDFGCSQGEFFVRFMLLLK